MFESCNRHDGQLRPVRAHDTVAGGERETRGGQAVPVDRQGVPLARARAHELRPFVGPAPRPKRTKPVKCCERP
jgi:hypothetical protein